MTQMPQLVAIFNGFGGGASALVACAEFSPLLQLNKRYLEIALNNDMFTVVAIALSIIVGTLTLTGSFTSGNFIFKPELRLDSASSEIFAISPTETSDSLTSFVMAMIYTF